jgi:type I restriction enzyme, S subunit
MKHPQLPSDWRLVPLSKVAQVQTGLALGKEAKVDPVRVPYLRVANVQDGFLDLGEIKEVVIERSLVSRYSLRPGDVLMTEGGDYDKLGRGFIWHDEIPNCLHQNHVFVVRPHTELLSYFLAALTSSDYGRAYFQGCSKQSTNLASINSSQLKAFLVPLPPIREQEAVTWILSTWDRGIRQVADLVAAKVRFKQGLMQQLLTGKRRLDVHRHVQLPTLPKEVALRLGLSATAVVVERGLNGKSYDEGIPKLGVCPPGWETRKLEELLTVTQRPVGLHPNKTYRLVTAKRYRAGIVPREEVRGEQIKTSTQFETKTGDFLISRRQIVHGACGPVPASLDGAIVSNEYSCLQISDDIDPAFFEYLTHTRYMQRTFYQSSVGVAVEKMIFRIDNWLDYDIHVPPLAEQKRIVGLLTAIDQEIVLLDGTQRALAAQKKGLMQKLLTGQMRLKP